MSDAADELRARRFGGSWRRYQQQALDAFEADRAGGDHRFFAVLPPGAGKTLIGLEVARRLGRRTLVLAPNTAVAGQWAATWDRRFVPGGAPCGTDRDLTGAVNVLTYQSIAVLRPGTGAPHRRATLRGGSHDELLDLLHPNGRAVIEAARGLGPWTLVLDECHHLLSTWGALVRAVVDALGERTALVGLTATPRRSLTGWQAELHDDLFGPADLEVPAPALVKAGTLAPYQELVYLTRPTPAEDTWLASETVRFAQLRFQLIDHALGTVPLLAWLSARADRAHAPTGAHRDRAAGEPPADGPRLSWAAFEAAEPALARAALRFAHAGMIALPAGARLREMHRTAPDADDWVAVLGDFCTGHLQASEDDRDVAALAAIKRVLPGLGYRLTSRGLRAGPSPVDRLCGLSEAKIAATTHILATESAARGDRLRALVLCDFEQLPGRPSDRLTAVPLNTLSGSARLAFATLAAADVDGPGGLRPLLVTGATFAAPRALAAELVSAANRAGRRVGTEPLDEASVLLTGLPTRAAVALATEFFAAGRARVLIGTRALLGEGWDCPQVCVTVDLTTATTATAVTQMRGRGLRRDPADPAKLTDNWTVCCVAAEHPRGDADYLRLVRKHDAYFALGSGGEVESGVTHCDTALSPYVPPDAATAAAVTARALAAPARLARVRGEWRIGAPFAGVEAASLRVRSERPLGRSAPWLPGALLAPTAPAEHGPRIAPAYLVAGAVAVLLAASSLLLGPVAALAGGALAVAAGLAGIAVGLVRRHRIRTGPDALEQLAAAVADALHTAGGTERGAEALRVSPTVGGALRCELTGVPAEQSARFAAALDELLAPLAEPRYLVGRRVLVAPAGARGAVALAVRSMARRPLPGAVAWHALPRWCARNAVRRESFAAAWERHVGPARLLAADSVEGAAVCELMRGEDPFAITAQLRTVWH
ncbi:DEAD/DEAH box helicase family protein [Actinocatenispora sera]|uniref:DEAD/DEAH box helicase family protein n=1 Tax=Actinocatenispora sera TaxID=390989 RepID=UPI0033CEC9EA